MHFKNVNEIIIYKDNKIIKKISNKSQISAKKFKYAKLKKYVNKSKNYQLLKSFDNKLISFSNSYYKNNKYGVQSYDKSNKWNYILFWNKVTRLEPIYNY